MQDYHWAKEVGGVGGGERIFESVREISGDGRGMIWPLRLGLREAWRWRADGEMAFVSQGATRPQEVWLWDQKSAPKQITHLNDSWKEFALSPPEYLQIQIV